MPGKLRRNDYDLVEEAYDSKSPVHSEDAFEHGITFKVKYIGTKEIHKPSSRAEIVAAMRRIRYEYKMYGARKERTELTVAVSGIKVIRREEAKRGWISQKKKDFGETEVMYHPINRIFYVSHDSQDLQIFSFIAKDDDVFRCSVFKANNKSDAVHIVRTIGQAFEVSHRRTLSQQEDVPEKTESEHEEKKLDMPMETAAPSPEGQMDLSGDLSWENKDHQLICDPGIVPLTIQQLRQIYQQQLDHQRHETQAAMAQVKLLTQQLNAEAEARQELQNQLGQVLRQNKQLVITIQQLVDQVHVLQSQARGRGDSGVSLSLDMDGRIASVTSNSSQAPSLPVVSPVKTGSVVLAPSAKLRNLGEPVFPHIPPPANTPSPVMSHRSDMDAFDGSFSSLQSSSKVESMDSFIRNGGAPEHSPLPTLVDLSSSEPEMVDPRKEPIPQQFLQFVFDSNSSPSTPVVVTPVNSLQRNNKNKAANSPIGQNTGEKSTIINSAF